MTNPSHHVPRYTGPDPHWSELGNCRGAHPSTMFPEPQTPAGWQRARMVCRGCPVIEQCAEAGLDELYGMWGGMSPDERRRLRVKRDRRRRKA